MGKKRLTFIIGIWAVIKLLEGYGNDNSGANAHIW
ncbi:MAG: Maff2 family protein [Lachnospiraceae bacterium]|nr:Maff2 family protein [Lachnospiraceae bacterium]